LVPIGSVEEEGGTFWKPYRGEPFDPEAYELVTGGWDHEHCDVCCVRIADGDVYWTNDGPDHVDLCTTCYPLVLQQLASAGSPTELSKERTMSDTPNYPYATHLNVLYPPLEVVDVPALVAACTDQWYNQTLCRVNDSVVRLGVIRGEYHWHKHDTEDEFFYTVSGLLLIDLEGRTVELKPGQGVVIPKGVMHRTRAPERTVILMVEGAGIVPTGDA
jgi:mannose-6-phosphate isomerase-like protein (cupin superfamily)